MTTTATTVKDTPILMCGEMVRQTLADLKTETRRVVKPQPTHSIIQSSEDGRFYDANCINPGREVKCPYGSPGDRLWVRETFAPHPEFPGWIYRADRGGDYQGSAQGDFKWKPSIFMPRRASRITLEITGVRVERLNEISDEDAILEGIATAQGYAVIDYAQLWDSINGKKHPWPSNPWVWVIEFKLV